MATRRKERYHITGNSNKNNSHFTFSDTQNDDILFETNNGSNGNDNNIDKSNRNNLRENILKNNKHYFTEETIKSYNNIENDINANDNNFLNTWIDSKNKSNTNIFEINKHMKEREIEFVKLNNMINETNNINFKNIPCKFKKNVGKKSKANIDRSTAETNNIKDEKKDKEIQVDELWNYLSYVHNSDDSRLKYKINDIIYKRTQDEKADENFSQSEKMNGTELKHKDNTDRRSQSINYDEYKNIIKYILPSMPDKKIDYSWNCLKTNLKCESDKVDYKEFVNFINEKSENYKNIYINKIVASQLKNKVIKYNFNPSDVKLKTINYIDNIRLKASEFSKAFNELISEKELYDLFKGKEKIKISELEKIISDITNERTKHTIEGEDIKNTKETNKKQGDDPEDVKELRKKDILTDFNMKAYISTLLTNKNNEVFVKNFIDNLNINYEALNLQNHFIKDAYDFYSRNIPPTEKMESSYNMELNKEEVKRAKFLIEEIDYSVRNNFRPKYLSEKNNNAKKNPQNPYLSLYEIFKHLDNDKDSYITKEDLHKSLNNLKIKNITNEDVNLLLKYIDTQKKGYIDVNDFLTNYQLEDKSMISWIKNTNKPYFEFVQNLKREDFENSNTGSRRRSISENIPNNENAFIAKKYDDAIYNYNLELDQFCPSYIIRERIRNKFIAKPEDFLNKHIHATKFHLTPYKNTNNIIQPVENSDLYMNDNSRFKTTYNLNYN
ncbi:calcium-binding protein, putative [Plasmodium chabaudi adami]|uniref:Calcium-binding protein, putative n=1 Tax=Plasmodium chabaudi adami TaxID=5826 RepID=A0A1C6XKP4_PLACE|nr:calcium-binding protein, putative [Plasmodium chabaudi adami]